jgi:hypothetical protein
MAILRVLPSICSLVDEDVIHRPEAFLALADRINAAVSALAELETKADPAEVVKFLALTAERRGFALPSPSLLAMDARAVAAEMPADLLPLACGRLWARFAYRRLPEPSDFLAAVHGELAERRESAARIKSVALKIQHAQWLKEQRRKADERHAAAREQDRQLQSRHCANPSGSKPDLPSVKDGQREIDLKTNQTVANHAVDIRAKDRHCSTMCSDIQASATKAEELPKSVRGSSHSPARDPTYPTSSLAPWSSKTESNHTLRHLHQPADRKKTKIYMTHQ